MTTDELRNSVNSLSAADRATATIQQANLVEKQSRILGEPIPDLVLRVLEHENPALVLQGADQPHLRRRRDPTAGTVRVREPDDQTHLGGVSGRAGGLHG